MTRNLSVRAKVSTLALAAAIAAGPSPAAAQSFQGSVDSATGATVDQSTPGQTNVSVSGSQAVINWTATNDPSGGQIVFQPDGTVATFSGATDFAVLNRITPGTAGNAIYMGGTIQSLVGDVTGGTVFFYSPNGIVIGQNAVINVGSLGLTTLPIADDGQGNWMSGFGGSSPQVTFGQATDPNSYIHVQSMIDGSIRSNGAGSYVALVAPRIHHQGRILTDGTAALVAAEAATITFDPFGLFTIQVTTGTDAATGIHVDGGTIDRNSETISSDNIHRAYLVAVAKNDAVTMLINNGASVGFEIGTSASVEDNAVVISGGYDIDNGSHQFFGTSGVSNVPLTITNATLSSDVDAKVTGGAAINSGEGALTFGGDLSVIGGETTTTGGNVLIDAMNGNALTIGGDLYARAFRESGDGTQIGLITRLGATGGSTATVGGDVTLDSDSFGATVGEFGVGTDVTGGNAQVNIGANSTLNVTGSINVHADGYGGGSFSGTAGDGTGGQALVMAITGNASVTVGGSVSASASGFGGSYIECSECGVTGGNGLGGNASVHTNVGSGNSLDISGDVTVTASGHGGAGDAQAGSGIGGTANLGASDNSSLTVGADTEVDASGFGGDGVDNQGGLGRGGTAHIGTNTGGSIELTGPVFVTAHGEGGSSFTLGGTGTGGVAQIGALLGTIHAFGDVSVSAHSSGGFAFGSGTGGDGLADIESTVTPVMTEASLFAGGGTLTVDGLTVVSAGATGGAGGFDGGDGGNALAAGIAGTVNGGAIIHAGNSDAGPSVIELAGVTVAAEAFGGAGGNGQGGVDGSDGGNGGSATGGKAVMTAAAGSGDLTAGAVIISASAVGGDGGSGGGGDGGAGGNGGDGGNATGGFINVGSESGNANFAQGSNNGVATYTSILSFANATGGGGGDAGFGSPAGVAGNGGDATGGNNVLLVRGSIVNVGTVNLEANATGGNGGLNPNESQGGVGGDAVTGTVGVLATNRFQLPDQRGTLNAGAITGNAIATGGQGSTNGGQWTVGGGAFFEFVNSEGVIDSLNLIVGADGIDPGATETFASSVAIVESTVDVANGFNIQTPGRISIHVDNPEPVASLTAASFTVTADNFVHDESRALPADVGTISADTISLGTSGDLIVDAHLVSTSSLTLIAPGLIDIEDATSGGDLTLIAGSSIAGGTQSAAGNVFATAPGAITLGNIVAGDSIDVISTDGDLLLGSLSAANFIYLETGGSIGFGDATADDFDFDAGGSVTGGDILAGTVAGGTAVGQITLGDISVGVELSGGATEDGFAVGFASETGITVGDVEADEAIGFATFGDLVAGDLDSGVGVMTLIGGDTSIASITTPGDGQVYHGDAQMFVDAGGPDNFDPLEVLSQPPVPSGGSYTVAGPIVTGQMRVAAASIDTGDISASDIALQAAGSVTTGAIDTGALQIDAGTDITTGDIFTFGAVDLDAGGSILTGDIDAGSIDLLAGGDITTGYLNTQLIGQLGDGFTALLFPGASITLESGGDISTGDISSIDGVYLNAAGSILTGMIDAFDFVEAHAGGDLQTEEIDAGDYILLTADAGDILIGASSAGTNFQAAAGGNLVTGSISATEIDARAGGTAAIDGIWSADYVQLTSNDLNITTNGAINAAEIDLISSNATQTVVGDGVGGGGYQLSDAEYDRLQSGDIDVIADAGLGAAPRILIGDLSVTAPGGDGGSEYEFVTVGAEGEPAGSVRIVGDALFSNMGADDGVAFSTNLFELDAATGLLSLESTPGTLGGVIYFDAAKIHVASGEILDRLAEEGRYEGYQDDLNAPAEVQRTDGVVRAESIEIEFYDGGEADINSLYVQNTGTADMPAGFLVGQAVLFGEGNEVTPPPGSIDLIINGQIVTEGGTLTGIEVRDALVAAEGDLSPFTDNSTINGCLLTGPCEGGGGPSGPFPPGFTPTPGIQDVIELIDEGQLPPPVFGNEDFIDDNIDTTTDGATSPIAPPTPLFDTSELGGKSDVDDPVSGSGNPALMENAPASESCPAGGSQPAGQCKQEKQQ